MEDPASKLLNSIPEEDRKGIHDWSIDGMRQLKTMAPGEELSPKLAYEAVYVPNIQPYDLPTRHR